MAQGFPADKECKITNVQNADWLHSFDADYHYRGSDLHYHVDVSAAASVGRRWPHRLEISYLTKDEQAELWSLIEQEDAMPSLPQALIKTESLRKYFPRNYSVQSFKDMHCEAKSLYRLLLYEVERY